MKRTFVLPLSLLLLSACSGQSEDTSPIPEVSVEEAAARIAAGTAVAVDANGAETRSERGVVPGARLLTPAFGGGLTYCAHVIQWGERAAPLRACEVDLPPCTQTALEMVQALRAAKASDAAAPGAFAAPLVA